MSLEMISLTVPLLEKGRRAVLMVAGSGHKKPQPWPSWLLPGSADQANQLLMLKAHVEPW